MLLRYKLMALLAALIILIIKVMTIKIKDQNAIEDHTKPTASHMSLLPHLAQKNEEKFTSVKFAADEFSLKPPKPCECSANELKKALAKSNGPDPPFLPAYHGGKA